MFKKKEKKEQVIKEKKKIDEKRLFLKLTMCIAYLIVITILSVCTYKLYNEETTLVPWDKVDSTKEYTYIKISKMSEKFAYYEETNLGIHFVIQKEETGQWHTYLVGINEDDYNKYKKIIDYTYDRIKEEPEPITVYGYPVVISQELKEMSIKNVANFVPAENEVVINDDNYETYLTNSYLDTTQSHIDELSPALFVTVLLLVTVIFLFIATIFNKDKIVDGLNRKIERDIRSQKKLINNKNYSK